MSLFPRFLSSWEAHRAVKEDRINFITEQFRDKKFDPNARFRGQTLLTTCVLQNNSRLVQLLLDFGANPNAKSDEGGRYETPMISAVRRKHLNIVKILTEHGAEIVATNFYGQDALYHAIDENAFDILEYLLTCCPLERILRTEHEPPSVVCPFHLALTKSFTYPLKRKSLFLLIKFNYSCSCLQDLIERIYPISKFQNDNSPEKDVIPVDSEVLQWIRHAFPDRTILYGLPKPHEIKLTNVSRLAIRTMSTTLAVQKKSNLVHIIQAFPLPSILIDFLLFKDLQFTHTK